MGQAKGEGQEHAKLATNIKSRVEWWKVLHAAEKQPGSVQWRVGII